MKIKDTQSAYLCNKLQFTLVPKINKKCNKKKKNCHFVYPNIKFSKSSNQLCDQ